MMPPSLPDFIKTSTYGAKYRQIPPRKSARKNFQFRCRRNDLRMMQSMAARAGGMMNAATPFVCAPSAQQPQNAKYAQNDAVSRLHRYTVTAIMMKTASWMSASARRPQKM